MRGSDVSVILVEQLINVIRKSKKIKSKSQKFRIKKYSVLRLGINGITNLLSWVNQDGIDKEINQMEIGKSFKNDSKIITPINISYKAPVENINIKFKV